MDEKETVPQEAPEPQGEGAQAPAEAVPQGVDAERTDEGAQAPDAVDWKREARKWEDRAKRDAARADRAESELAEAKAREARAAEVARVAKEAGVDVELLAAMSGDTAEEIEANAKLAAEKMAAVPRYPAVEDRGAQPPAPVTRDAISAIEDPGERIRARAQNIGMYGI